MNEPLTSFELIKSGTSHWRRSFKKGFLKVSQNSQKKTCDGVRQRFFPVNTFHTEHLRVWLFIFCKSWKKIFFWKKIFVFYKIDVICKKNAFIWKKNLYRDKYKWKCKKNMYLISEIYFYTENVCVTNMYSYIHFAKKNFFDHKKYIC